MKSRNNIEYIGFWTRVARIIFNLVYSLMFPAGIVSFDNKILAKVNQAAEEGVGTFIVFTHFSYRDPVELNRVLIFKNPVLKHREIVNPIAFHQHKFLSALLLNAMHARGIPIVNQDTLNRKGYEHLKKGGGLTNFIEESVKVLSRGGIVTCAANAGRREKLDLEDKQRPVGYFVLAAQAKGLTDFGILLVSFALKDAHSYAKKDSGGMNFGRRYILTVAGYYDSQELLLQPEVNGKAGNIDLFIRKKLARVAPKEYLPKNYHD